MDSGLFSREADSSYACHMAYLINEDDPAAFGELAFEGMSNLDKRLRDIGGWVLPDFGMDYQLMPSLITYCYGSSVLQMNRKIEKLARWLSAHDMPLQAARFELHCYGKYEDTLISSRTWRRNGSAEMSGSSGRVVPFRMTS